MSVSGIGSDFSPISAIDAFSPTRRQQSAGGPSASAAQSGGDQFTSDFATILAAVQSGDISSAQQALKTLQGDASSLYSPAGTSAAPSPTSTTSASPVAADVQSLFSAIQSGDSTAAQSALTKLKSDAAAQVQGHHGGHHHHHGGGAAVPAPAIDTTDATNTDPFTSNDGGLTL